MYAKDFDYFKKNQVMIIDYGICSRLESRVFREIPYKFRKYSDQEIEEMLKEVHTELMYKDFKMRTFLTGDQAKAYLLLTRDEREHKPNIGGYFEEDGAWTAFDTTTGERFIESFSSSYQACRFALGMIATLDSGTEI